MDQQTEMLERSSFRVGRIEVKYYVREPSPGVWNAIGVLYLDQAMMPAMNRCPMVVGVGSTYHEAVGDLLARVLSGNHPDLPRQSQPEDVARLSGTSETIRNIANAVTETDSMPASR